MELKEENYYTNEANVEYMSFSQFKDFLKCPAYAIAKIKGQWKDEETESLLVGSYVDSYLDGELDKFKSIHPELFLKTGELKASYRMADNLIKEIENDAEFKRLLTGERQKIMTGFIAGVPFKIKIDSLLKDRIVDGKVLKDCEDCYIDKEWHRFHYKNRYDIQGAIYQQINIQNTFEKLPFTLAIITKEKQPDKRVFEFSDETLQDALNEVIVKAPVFQAMKNGTQPIYACGCCDYCKSIKKIKMGEFEIL